MPKYRIQATQTTYLISEIEAPTIDEAFIIAQEQDASQWTADVDELELDFSNSEELPN